jgi:deoxycytidylate deaminase
MGNIDRILNCLGKCDTKIYETTRPCCVNSMDLNNADIKEIISYQYKTLKEFLVQSAVHHTPVVLTC